MKGISIIIPSFNRERFIEQAISSVIHQEYEGKVEIIVSDDGSTDQTIETAELFGNQITVLKKPADCPTQGASGARNRGIKASTQPYICFLDSDDYFLPGHLKKMATAIESREELGFVFCRILETDESMNPNLFRQWTRSRITNRDIRNPVVSGNFVVCTNVFLFQRYVFDEVGYFTEGFINGEDGDMWMRITEIFRGTFSDHFGAVRRKHGIHQLTHNNKKSLFRFYCLMYKNALKRYHQLGLRDSYRLFRLRWLFIKYRLSYLNAVHWIYPVYLKFANQRKVTTTQWHQLSYFINDEDRELSVTNVMQENKSS